MALQRDTSGFRKFMREILKNEKPLCIAWSELKAPAAQQFVFMNNT